MACPTVGVLGEAPEMGERGRVSTQKHRRRAGTGIKALVSVSLCWEGFTHRGKRQNLEVWVSLCWDLLLLPCCFFFCLKFGGVVCFLCRDAYREGIVNFRVSLFCPLNVHPARDIPGPEAWSLPQPPIAQTKALWAEPCAPLPLTPTRKLGNQVVRPNNPRIRGLGLVDP